MATMSVAEMNQMFLTHSHERMVKMNTPDGTAYTPGKKLRFTAPILPGWAAKIRVFYDLVATVTLGTGTAAVSAAAPYNVIQNQRLLYGGAEHRNHHPYFNRLLKQTSEHDGGYWTNGGPAAQGYAASLITAPAVAAGANTWKGFFDIPLQMGEQSVMGLLPMGSSASPITLELDCAPQIAGTDAFLNPVYVTGDATATMTGTVTAVVYYRYGQSVHDPRTPVPTPVIGAFGKILQSETPITSNAGVTYAELKDPFPHLKIMQLCVIPSQAAFCTFANIAGAKLDLDATTPYRDYTEMGAGINSLWFDQRDRYGQDLDAGVVVWDFISGDDPKHPSGLNTVNIELYNAARAGIHYNGALAGASNRIITASMILEKLTF